MKTKVKLALAISVLLLAFQPVCARSEVYFCLIDISGSISKCQDGFTKNLRVINGLIDRLQKGDRFIAYAYRSSGSLVEVADEKMPSRSGPRNRFLAVGRARIRRAVVQGLKRALESATGEGTDCVGALNQALLLISDFEQEKDEIVLLHFSDGFQTTGVGSFKPEGYKTYLKRLEKRLARSGLLKQDRVSRLVWFGATCNLNQKLTLNQAAYLKSTIRRTWLKFLVKNMPTTQVRYLLDYESGESF